MNRTRRFISQACLLGTLLGLATPDAFADAPLHIAVAANFTAPIKLIAADFKQQTGKTVLPSFGATGMLYAQIRNGAPFALFLSADSRRPRLLAEQGLAVPSSRRTYAIGRLVLWSPHAGRFGDGGKVLRTGQFARLSIAEPKAAPYGAAAQQVLEHMGLWHSLQPRIVRGQSLTQAYQYVASGNAQLGFVALSQIALLPPARKGSQWLVPQSFYKPIEQQVVLLKRAANDPTAKAFYAYLKSPKVEKIIRRYGYEIAR
ncbi:molybdate ABC transporter substrate-binding protein [Acidihalobacter aeolianus]|uniref:Molybdate ABC transporter substrate-binding protein n=1 Tax=Acidihalobacter aeolianus TaxID=2792603 RepID=A0A1D8K9Y4_9GAMM|nr:molybdate ABC transporter substrate-binding protein [Acidihalobacter aeolianus]AOV17783.1 molybdate ABC transporter substrate-binding protein [Acidihalobacter aeolianus]